MFDLDTFITDCIAASTELEPQRAVAEALTRAVDDSVAVARALPASRAEIERIYVSPALTILKVVWAPGMRIFPHDHRMWATIGIYGGQEDNTFYRRSPVGVVASGGRQLHESDVALLGDNAIHAVLNPRSGYTGAIHVYGGDFFSTARSEFDPDTLAERPYDVERTLALFEDATRTARRPDTPRSFLTHDCCGRFVVT